MDRRPNPGSYSCAGPKIPLWRKLLYAVVTVLLVLGAAEGTLRVMDFQGTTVAELEATAGFNHGAYVQRRDRIYGDWFLEELGPNGGRWMRSNPALVNRGFHRQRFPVSSEGELRVFAIGGSTTFGTPYEHQERGFPHRLEKVLQKKHPSYRWRMINAGVAGMDSRSFPRMMKEIVKLSPHGLVIYTGNNELRGALIEACSDPYREGLERWLNQVRLVRLARSTYRQHRADQKLTINQMALHQDNCMTREVDRQLRQARVEDVNATPDDEEPWFPVGPARTDRWYVEAVRTFARNLERVLDVCRGAGIKVYLVLPAVNLRGAPMLTRPRVALGAEERRRRWNLVASAEGFWEKKKPAEARRDVEAALALDPTAADANHLAGLMDLAQGKLKSARRRLQLAVDRDYQGGRVTSHMEGALRQLCKLHPEIACVDAKAVFTRASKSGVPGKDLFVDFCHPTFDKGVQLIADELARVVKPAELMRK